HIVPLGSQQIAEQLDVGRRVVDNQDPLRHYLRPFSIRRFTVSRNSFRLIGLLTKASNPAALMALRSVGVTEAVSATTGMRAVVASPRIGLNASMPLMPGSWMSISTRSGFFSLASFTPSSPVIASTVWYPLA